MVRTTMFAALIALGAAFALLQGGNAASTPSPAQDQARVSEPHTSFPGLERCIGPIERKVRKVAERVDEERWGDELERWLVGVYRRFDCGGNVGRYNTMEWYLPADVPTVITLPARPHCSWIRTNESWAYARNADGSLVSEATEHGPRYSFVNSWTNGCGAARSSSTCVYNTSGISRRIVTIRERTITADNRMVYKIWVSANYNGPGHECPLGTGVGYWAYDPPDPIPAPDDSN